MVYNRATKKTMKKTLFVLVAAVLMAASATAQPGLTRMAQRGQASVPQLKAAKQQNAKEKAPIALKRAAKSVDNPLWADTMSYCLDEPFYNGIGMGNDSSIMRWGIKIEAAALVGRNNITEVHFFVPAAGNYEMSIIFGASPVLAPGATAAYSQTIAATAADTMAWKTVALSSPLPVVAGQAMWVTFTNTGIPYPAAAIDGATYLNGTYASLDGLNWAPLPDFNLENTWMIRVVSDTYTVQAPMVTLAGPSVAQLNQTLTFTASSPNSDSYEWYVDGASESETSSTLTYTFTTDGMHQVVVGGTNTSGTTYDTIDVDVVDCTQPIADFPHVETFEGGVPCWTFVSADTANDYLTGVAQVDASTYGASAYVLSSYDRAEDYNQYLISPELDLDEGTQYAVRFWVRGRNASDVFRVRASSTTNDTAAFTTLLADVNPAPTAWIEVAYILPAGTKYVAINYYGDYAYYLFVGNFEVSELTEPSVTLAGPDSVGTGINAVYTASTVLADSLAWYVNGTFVAGGANTYTHVFTAAGNYQVMVEAINAVGSIYDTLDVIVYSCDGTTIPYAPDFSEGFGCWFNESRLTQGMGWYASVEAMTTPVGQVVSLSGQASFFGVTDVPTDNWLFSPVITMPATGSYEVAWQVMSLGAPSYPGDHYGLYLIAGTDTTLLFEETLSAADTVLGQRVVLLPASLSGDFRLAFRHFNCAGGYALVLDQIELRAMSAAIVNLRGPASVLINEPATFTAVSSNADSYAWTVDGSAVSETSATLTHTFTTAGNHTVSVTATNSVGSNSATMTVTAIDCGISTFPYENGFESEALNNCWNLFATDPMDYGFLFNDTPEYSRSGNACLFGAYSDDVNVDQWAVSPAITLPAEATNFVLSWYVKLNEWEGIPSQYEVRLSTTGRTAADFTTTLFSESGDNAAYEFRNVSLADYAGQTIFIAFHNITAMGGDAMAIDDLRIGEGEVSIDQVASTAISVSPNPATGMVNVSAEGIEGRVSVEIVDLNGRVVMQQQGNAASYRFDVSNLAAGAYFVRLTGENTNAVQKLIVK